MDRTHPKKTRRPPERTGMDRTHINKQEDARWAHGNGPNAPERPRRPQGRTGMDGTHPTTPREHGNGPKASEGSRRPPGWTRMDRTHPNEPDDTHGARKWTQRNATHTNGPDDPQGKRSRTERTLGLPHERTLRPDPNAPYDHGNQPKAHKQTP